MRVKEGPDNKELSGEQIEKLFKYGLKNEYDLLMSVFDGSISPDEEGISDGLTEVERVESAFKHDPKSFFNDENLKFEATFHPGNRLGHLLVVCSFLEVDEDDIKKYFSFTSPNEAGEVQDFKNDLHILRSIKFEESGLIFGPSLQRSVEFILNIFHNENVLDLQSRAFLDRRKLVGKHLFSKEKTDQIYGQGLSVEGFEYEFEQFLNETSGYKVLANFNPESVNNFFLSDFFKNLDQVKKVNFLLYLVSYLHKRMMEVEVYGSVFTKESAKRRTLEVYNQSHSSIFRTPQNTNAYYLPPDFYLSLFEGGLDSISGDSEKDNYTLQAFLHGSLYELSRLEVTEFEIDFIVDFWVKNGNPIFTHWIYEILKKQPENSCKFLINALKKERDPDARTPILEMLYKLEVGNIELSKLGLKYHGKVYDLGKYNISGGRAERVSLDQGVSVFGQEDEDGNREIQTNLDINFEKESVSELALSFAYITDPESQDVFKSGFYGIFVKYFQEKIGIRLSGFTFETHERVFMAVRNTSREQLSQMHEFLKIHKEAGFSAISYFDHLSSMGEVFKRDTKTISTFVRVSGVLETLKSKNPDFVQRKQREINSLVSDKKITDKEIEEKLAKYDEEILVTVAMAKETDFKDFEIEVQTVPLLIERDKENMRDLYKQNYQIGNELDSLLRLLEENFKNDNAKFYILRSKGKVIGFMVLKKEGEEKGYQIYKASGFNMNPITHKEKIGGEFLKSVLDLHGYESRILADCELTKYTANFYLSFGFVGTKVWREDETGKLIMDIEYRKANKEVYRNVGIDFKDRLALIREGRVRWMKYGKSKVDELSEDIFPSYGKNVLVEMVEKDGYMHFIFEPANSADNVTSTGAAII